MKRSRSSKKSASDLKRPQALKDQDIDLSEIPEVSAEKIARGVLRYGLKPVDRRELLVLRLDRDVAEWYRKQRGYEARINALLRDYMREKLRASDSSRTRRAS